MLDAGYRLDLVVEDQVIVEIKAVSELLPVHEARLLFYLKQAGLGKGLLLNFNVKLLKNVLRRLVV
jgi:GxxExxY protein